ncbi:hypothetical protein C8034_v007905 [Colletotrichum sidae]|uniref:Uncharacterized protein n=1 Tax=Colletotrichum sidae TaxID=1347389 RepID=A0A4R8TQB5_9PEZI|nr:hypothetical protein C8034_v007905 [Colletotrichum sidae]
MLVLRVRRTWSRPAPAPSNPPRLSALHVRLVPEPRPNTTRPNLLQRWLSLTGLTASFTGGS